jgi:hypothetical protein
MVKSFRDADKNIAALCLLALLALNAYYRFNYRSFYAVSDREFRIPGLSEGFTPQGLTQTEDGVFLACGYLKDGGPSRVYVIGDKARYIQLVKANGAADENHAGGLAAYGNWLYLTNEDSLAVYALDAVLTAPSGDALKPVYEFPVGLHASFVYVEGDKLYVGEFYRAENYPTDETHHMTTDAGQAHYALMAVYPLSPDKEYGFASQAPDCVYSITGLAQGVCLTESGSLCLSASYGTAHSYIYVYEDPAQYPYDGTFEIKKTKVPLYYLDANHLIKTVKLFPMSEELVYSDGRIYVMCESASNKYVFGKFTGNGTLYSFPVE